MKTNIIVFTQNLKLESLVKLQRELNNGLALLLITTQYLFENEIRQISSILGEFTIHSFADYLSDHDMETVDKKAYLQTKDENLNAYYSLIKKLKNKIVVERILSSIKPAKKILLCDDLGIDKQVWLEQGFQFVALDYYYVKQVQTVRSTLEHSYWKIIKNLAEKPIYTCRVNNKKVVFFGKMNRIDYRMNCIFKRSKTENYWFILNKILSKLFHTVIVRNNVEYISTLHESAMIRFPVVDEFKVGLIQDGYLPPNYSSLYLKYKKPNEYYYAWDTLGMQLFVNQGIPVKMLPIRKKLYMPVPIFKAVRTVLCVASGAGDWTAMKNRSDEDKMINAFVEMAKKHPDIKFIYRCHPVWVHPEHQGINSINRVVEYFAWLNLPNLVISANIPALSLEHFELSISRNSLEADIEQADIVFGEHSVSMIDAAFKKIPFASVNVTGRRNFFCGLTSLGFPHCKSLSDIEAVIKEICTPKFVAGYKKAVNKYNQMTDEE